MLDANFSSLVSSTITVLNSTKNDYNNVSGDRRLPRAFHEAGQGLLLIEEVFQYVKSQTDGRNIRGDHGDTIRSLEACKAKAELSEGIFKDVSQAPETERFEYYKRAVRRKGECNPVEVLVMGMMSDVCDMAKDSAIEAIMRTRVKVLREALEKLSKMEPSVKNKQSGNIFSSYGSGNQFNATGGAQNNNTGSGNQFSGASFSGPVHFGRNMS
jgi:hypothetical protein